MSTPPPGVTRTSRRWVDDRSVLEVLSKKCSDKLGISLDAALTDEQSEQLRAAVLGEVIEKVLAQQ
jgi:hypothetical protein